PTGGAETARPAAPRAAAEAAACSREFHRRPAPAAQARSPAEALQAEAEATAPAPSPSHPQAAEAAAPRSPHAARGRPTKPETPTSRVNDARSDLLVASPRTVRRSGPGGHS